MDLPAASDAASEVGVIVSAVSEKEYLEQMRNNFVLSNSRPMQRVAAVSYGRPNVPANRITAPDLSGLARLMAAGTYPCS